MHKLHPGERAVRVEPYQEPAWESMGYSFVLLVSGIRKHFRMHVEVFVLGAFSLRDCWPGRQTSRVDWLTWFVYGGWSVGAQWPHTHTVISHCSAVIVRCVQRRAYKYSYMIVYVLQCDVICLPRKSGWPWRCPSRSSLWSGRYGYASHRLMD